jgi:hypothetical protein
MTRNNIRVHYELLRKVLLNSVQRGTREGQFVPSELTFKSVQNKSNNRIGPMLKSLFAGLDYVLFSVNTQLM